MTKDHLMGKHGTQSNLSQGNGLRIRTMMSLGMPSNPIIGSMLRSSGCCSNADYEIIALDV